MASDFTTLNNPRFLYLAELHHPFPDWVASQPIPERGEITKKASTAFADQKRRLLPIHTKEAAFHSAINIFACMDEFDEPTFDRVKEACAFYGIEKDVEPYLHLFAGEHEKSASYEIPADGRYAIDTELGGQRFQLFPVNDSHDVIQSAFDLAKMASENRIHFLMFVPAAREIVKAAEDHGITSSRLPVNIARFGTERFPDAEKAASLIAGRENLCRDEEIRPFLQREYSEAVGMVESDPDGAMEKIAALDTQAGLRPNYRVSSAVPSAFDIVFGGPLVSEAVKAARENVLVLDVLVPLAEIHRITEIDAHYRLSKSAAETFSKLKDVNDARDVSLAIDSWQESDKKTLLRMAVDAAA